MKIDRFKINKEFLSNLQNRNSVRLVGGAIGALAWLAVCPDASALGNKDIARATTVRSIESKPVCSPQHTSVHGVGAIGTAYSFEWRAEINMPIQHFVRRNTEGGRFDSNDPDASLTVLVFLPTNGPEAQHATEALQALQSRYSDLGVRFAGIPVGVPSAELSAFARTYGPTIPMLCDPQGILALHYASRSVPDVLIWDNAGILRYHGTIDDSTEHTPARHRSLNDAIIKHLKASHETAGMSGS